MTRSAIILVLILLLNKLVFVGQIKDVSAPQFEKYNPMQPNQSYQYKSLLNQSIYASQPTSIYKVYNPVILTHQFQSILTP